ncbi:MAG TPA: zf-HC2 domain-containing protein [Blastocatellia bacterium]
MVKKSAHPDGQLFEYLSGALDAQSRLSVEEHLSECSGCAAVAGLVGALKDQTSNLKPRISQEHLSAGELAALFYSKSPRARNRAAAAHVAQCQSCAAELAQYAQAERAASSYDPGQAHGGEVPAAVWEMISEWEESSFAKPKPASDAISPEMIAKLFKLLSEQKDWLSNARRKATAQASREGETPNLVPVIVIDRSGRLRGVEMFEQVREAEGESILKHAEKSERFDKKPVHALLDFGEESRVVISDRINHDTVRLQQAARPDAKLRRADYFIIED